MKIGILNTDIVQLEGAFEFGQYPKMFSKVLWAVEPNIKFRTYEVQFGNYPLEINECDAYLITGSKASAYEDTPWIHSLQKFIQKLHENHKKLIGICFGHQRVAEALGGSVRESLDGWHVGVDSIFLNKEAAQFGSVGDEYNLIFSHKDEVIKLPKNAKLIGGSTTCPNGMFVIENHILCTQGHIELDKKFAKIVYDFRKDQIGNPKYQNACDTLTMKTDELELTANILRFLKN